MLKSSSGRLHFCESFVVCIHHQIRKTMLLKSLRKGRMETEFKFHKCHTALGLKYLSKSCSTKLRFLYAHSMLWSHRFCNYGLKRSLDVTWDYAHEVEFESVSQLRFWPALFVLGEYWLDQGAYEVFENKIIQCAGSSAILCVGE